jgi:hypothetical protein
LAFNSTANGVIQSDQNNTLTEEKQIMNFRTGAIYTPQVNVNVPASKYITEL